MGYNTEFQGYFFINRPLDEDTQKIIKGLNYTRRVKRDPNKLAKELDITTEECIRLYGKECEFYFNFDGDFGQSKTGGIIDYNSPPDCQPSIWCHWKYNKDYNSIEWDCGDKFYEYTDWIKYIIKEVLQPKDYKLNGTVDWIGEELDDRGKIIIKDNEVEILFLDYYY